MVGLRVSDEKGLEEDDSQDVIDEVSEKEDQDAGGAIYFKGKVSACPTS